MEHQQPRAETAIANAMWARRALDLYPIPREGTEIERTDGEVEGPDVQLSPAFGPST
jgi:hypothetical protein